MNKESDYFHIDVKCYEGYKENERPISFKWGSKHIIVKEIIDQWQGENYNYFKISDELLSIYIIRRDIQTNEWQIVFWNKQQE